MKKTLKIVTSLVLGIAMLTNTVLVGASAKEDLVEADINSGVLGASYTSALSPSWGCNSGVSVVNAASETGITDSIKINIDDSTFSQGMTTGAKKNVVAQEFDVSALQGTTKTFLLTFRMKTVTAGTKTKFNLQTKPVVGTTEQSTTFENLDIECDDQWRTYQFKANYTFRSNYDKLKFILVGYVGSQKSVYLADLSFCEYNNSSNIMNVVVDESNVVNTIDDNNVGLAFENAIDIFARQGVQNRNTLVMNQSLVDTIADMPTKTIRIGGANYNYIQWKKDIGAYDERQKYTTTSIYGGVVDSSSPFYYNLNNARHFGIVEMLKLVNDGCKDTDIFYNLNMYSLTDETDEYKRTTPVVVFASDGRYTINQTVLDALTRDAIDLIRFMTLDKDDPRAVDSNGFNWAARREELGITEPVNVKMWELGNEWYFIGDKTSTTEDDMTAAAYVDISQRFVSAIRDVFPEAKFAAHGHSDDEWNKTVLDGLGSYIDGYAWHEYYFYSQMNTKTLPETEKLIRELRNRDLDDKVKIYFTESGLNFVASGQSQSATGFNESALIDKGTFGRGLSYSAFLNNAMKYPEIGAIHCYIAESHLTDYNNTQNGTDNIPRKRPIHHVLTEYFKYAKGDLYDTACSDDSVLATPTWTISKYPMSYHSAAAFKTATGMRLFVTNLDESRSFNINLVSKMGKDYELVSKREYSCDDIYVNDVDKTNDTEVTNEIVYDDGQLAGTITIGPNTMLVLEYKDAGKGATVSGTTLTFRGNAPASPSSVTVKVKKPDNTVDTQNASVDANGNFTFTYSVEDNKRYNVSILSGEKEIYSAEIGKIGYLVSMRKLRGDMYALEYSTVDGSNCEPFVVITNDLQAQTFATDEITPAAGSSGTLKKAFPTESKIYIWNNINNLTPLAPWMYTK